MFELIVNGCLDTNVQITTREENTSKMLLTNTQLFATVRNVAELDRSSECIVCWCMQMSPSREAVVLCYISSVNFVLKKLNGAEPGTRRWNFTRYLWLVPASKLAYHQSFNAIVIVTTQVLEVHVASCRGCTNASSLHKHRRLYCLQTCFQVMFTSQHSDFPWPFQVWRCLQHCQGDSGGPFKFPLRKSEKLEVKENISQQPAVHRPSLHLFTNIFKNIFTNIFTLLLPILIKLN